MKRLEYFSNLEVFMFIAYDVKNGKEYGKLVTSIRNGTKISKTYLNLGLVIDKDKHFTVDEVGSESIAIASPEVRKNFGRSWIMNVVILIRCIVYLFTKKDILFFEAKRRNKSLFATRK